ncbi:phosphatidylinositol transfer protein csr1 [Knufia fluminis]|uniref:acid phosphatase n=1 Tax=Knufia fluminis TaxID=191047 RepID=A0AAN8IC55_9EURO|nr:phosphatidylinositol transfer protein csr1 [Knufia fluminis]
MAEGVFRFVAKNNTYIGEIDSCGTGAYHEQDPPDYRTMQTLEKNGITDYDHAARKVTKEDFDNFDYMFAMDASNLNDLQKMQRAIERKGKKTKAHVVLFGEFNGDGAEEVVDPYYGADNGFDVVFEQVKKFSSNFLKSLEEDAAKGKTVTSTAILVDFVTTGHTEDTKVGQEDKFEKEQEAQEPVLEDDRVPNYAAMPVPQGFLGNLTAEQDQKLKDFWALVLKTFGIKDPIDSTSTPSIADATAPATPEPGSAKKKEKHGLFHRKNKDTPSGAGSPAFSGSADADDKYGQTKELQEILATSSAADLREAFWSMVKKDHPDALLLRFLRARKWDIQKALAMMISTMHWRRNEMHVDDDIMRRGEGGALEDEQSGDASTKKEGRDFLAQLRMGKSFMHGVDKEGRPICLVRVRLHKGGEQTEKSLERYTVYLIESCRLALEPPVETATIVFDMTNFTMANMDYTPVKFMIKVFEANYPESLGSVLVHKAPWVFQGIWKIIKGWLDPVVAAKVHFTNGVDDLQDFIPKSHIIKELGGEEAFDYKYVEPRPGENDAHKEEAPKRELAEVRKQEVAKYEQKTFEWIHGQDTRGQRDELAQKLRDNYWKLDPYIRARSLYDRTGMIGRDGKLNFYPSLSEQQGILPASNGVPPGRDASADDVD